ncbi:MAG: hypothetical protein M0Q90_17625, partial [Bacteroidales bacterium]|nr:hypothetical protein [Bacteroidales bacterium]
GKNTLVVKIGFQKALRYHSLLVLLPFVLLAVFLSMQQAALLQYAFLFTLPLFVRDLNDIRKLEGRAALDPYLRKLALKTLLLTFVFGILINL